MKTINLPQPRRTGGMPLMEALSKRCTRRHFDSAALPLEVISEILWAGFGFNREEKRTAPSSHNRQDIDLYLFLEEGTFLYDAKGNTLVQVAEGDLRALTGMQDFVAGAPANIALISDTSKITGKSPQGVIETIYADAGFISQNIYLYAASEGLFTVTRAMVDKEALAKALGLKDNQVITLVHSIGYPEKQAAQ